MKSVMALCAKQFHRMAVRGMQIQVCRQGYELLLDLNHEARNDEDIAHLLAIAYSARMEILNTVEKIRLDSPVEFRERLREDDIGVMQIFRDLVSTDDGQRAVLSLKASQRDAEGILNLIDRFHDDRTLWHIMCGISEDAIPSVADNAIGNEFKLTLNRLDVKLTIGSDLIPSSLIIQGISLLKDTSDKGGAFSDVYEGQSSDGTKVAVKKLRTTLNASDTRTYSRAFCREASIWKHLRHPNVLQFLGVNFELFPRSLSLVSLWAENDHIMRYLHTQGFISDVVHRLLYETARGLAYLHKENIVHGDLRTDPSARPSARNVAATLEIFSPMKDRQYPNPPPYLGVPSAAEGSRRRSIEDLRSEASSPSYSDISAEDTTAPTKPLTSPPAVLQQRRNNPRVRFGDSIVVPINELASSSISEESLRVENTTIPPTPPRRKSSKQKSHRKGPSKPEIPMYLNQTNHYIPRPLLRDSGIMGPGDNTINPLEPLNPSSLRTLHGQHPYNPGFVPGFVYGNPYLTYMPLHSTIGSSIQPTVVSPRDDPVIPPYPGMSPPTFGTGPNMHHSMYR
ncbi:hypothetical protein PHLGIDRAFT_115216 [Phlebiopsis gigantea 11061_1 CR5-6]|uniref:Protein kinase domain-containing protein n=1 Tax=Phlebiopsis gigantea (strain 11061_1 CR5-6) TaxID=745531 RepID=A0A0C3SEN4_PHLG1|nr:hypothetical protein PHLGIDRAFT_115216 [Phlebiopsis gigantea 11061_1 CR5-6]